MSKEKKPHICLLCNSNIITNFDSEVIVKVNRFGSEEYVHRFCINEAIRKTRIKNFFMRLFRLK